MQIQRSSTRTRKAHVGGGIRTHHTLVVSVMCGHERIHTPRHETSCPECGASAHRSFTLFRNLREDR
jgi:hypothetical protein